MLKLIKRFYNWLISPPATGDLPPYPAMDWEEVKQIFPADKEG